MPPLYRPQLARLVKHAPEGDDWLHEMKYDGYRIGCAIGDRTVTLLSRNGREWTAAFPEIVKAALQLGVTDTLLDGEIAIVLPDGRTSFQALQNSFDGGPRRGLVYFVFDVLRAGGENTERLPLERRKKLLLDIVGAPGPRTTIRYSEHVAGGGRRMFEEACRLKLEGIVSKKRDAPYTAGRTDSWLTTKCITRPPRGRTAAARTSTDVAGVRVTHPDRMVYPGTTITKLALARFYERISGWMVPHLRGRPLTLVRCPDGIGGPCFYMKHSKVWAPDGVRRVKIQEKTKVGEYLVVDSPSALVALVQMNIVEIHTWNTCVDHVELPDRIVFDIDPGARVPRGQVAAAARLVRRLLETVRLKSFPKTTGGSGLHVVVPLVPLADWSECLAFARALASAMERHDPGLYTTTFAKAGRERKILIDYLRNNRTNTSVAAYSARAREGAAVSTPLRWTEVTASLDPARFTVETIERRLARGKDAWAEYWTAKQRLTPAAIAAISGV